MNATNNETSIAPKSLDMRPIYAVLREERQETARLLRKLIDEEFPITYENMVPIFHPARTRLLSFACAIESGSAGGYDHVEAAAKAIGWEE